MTSFAQNCHIYTTDRVTNNQLNNVIIKEFTIVKLISKLTEPFQFCQFQFSSGKYTLSGVIDNTFQITEEDSKGPYLKVI